MNIFNNCASSDYMQAYMYSSYYSYLTLKGRATCSCSCSCCSCSCCSCSASCSARDIYSCTHLCFPAGLEVHLVSKLCPQLSHRYMFYLIPIGLAGLRLP